MRDLRPSSLARTLRAILAGALLAGCVTVPPPTSDEPTPLGTWLAQSAAPAIADWHASSGARAPVVIAVGGSADGAASELSFEAARGLLQALHARSVPAELAGPGTPGLIDEQACARGAGPRLHAAITIATAGSAVTTGDRVDVTVTPLVGREPSLETPVVARLALSRREQEMLRTPRSLPAAPGSIARPYADQDLDAMLAEFTQTLRCDLLRARWRTGAPEVSFDARDPEPWLRSFGLRLRDELARLDLVNGAPGSPQTVSRLELRTEPTADPRVQRIVVRVTADDATSGRDPAVAYQSYVSVRTAPVQHAALTTPPPVVAQPEPARLSETVERPAPRPSPPTPVPAPRLVTPVAAIGALRALTAASLECERAAAHGPAAFLPVTSRPPRTGDCFVLEFDGVRGTDLFVLHRGTDGTTTRLAPSSCLALPARSHWSGRFQLPSAGPLSPFIELTPPGGTEVFHAVMLGPAASASLRTELARLPDACIDGAAGVPLQVSQHLLEQLSEESRRGQAAVRTLSLTHSEEFPRVSANAPSRQ